MRGLVFVALCLGAPAIHAEPRPVRVHAGAGLPFSPLEIEQALALRVPLAPASARSGAVLVQFLRGEDEDTVVVWVGDRVRLLRLAGRRGAEAARFAALSIFDLWLEEARPAATRDAEVRPGGPPRSERRWFTGLALQLGPRFGGSYYNGTFFGFSGGASLTVWRMLGVFAEAGLDVYLREDESASYFVPVRLGAGARLPIRNLPRVTLDLRVSAVLRRFHTVCGTGLMTGLGLGAQIGAPLGRGLVLLAGFGFDIYPSPPGEDDGCSYYAQINKYATYNVGVGLGWEWRR